MIKHFFLLLFTFSFLALHAAPPQKPPPISEVKEEVKDAQALFEEAKKIFNPWYSGPLLTGSAHMMPPAEVNWQPYLFITDNFGAYNHSRSSKSIPDLLVINTAQLFQTGITSFMDCFINLSGSYKQQSGKDSVGFADLPIGIGFMITKEAPYIPALKAAIQQTFPTGKYRNSSKGGLDLYGNGSYVTNISLRAGKVVWWLFEHPMSLRLTAAYDIYPSKVCVRGVNAYGGAPDTSGDVTPGRGLALSFGYEASLTQHWVLAMDVAYTYNNKSTFSGFSGTNPDGSPASVGKKSSDSLSVAPAIEYNVSPKFGALVGGWFTVYGRNSSNFAGAIITVQWTFP